MPARGAKRYRYYVSSSLQHGGNAANTDGMRIPAPEIEALVSSKLAELFDEDDLPQMRGRRRA